MRIVPRLLALADLPGEVVGDDPRGRALRDGQRLQRDDVLLAAAAVTRGLALGPGLVRDDGLTPRRVVLPDERGLGPRPAGAHRAPQLARHLAQLLVGRRARHFHRGRPRLAGALDPAVHGRERTGEVVGQHVEAPRHGVRLADELQQIGGGPVRGALGRTGDDRLVDRPLHGQERRGDRELRLGIELELDEPRHGAAGRLEQAHAVARRLPFGRRAHRIGGRLAGDDLGLGGVQRGVGAGRRQADLGASLGGAQVDQRERVVARQIDRREAAVQALVQLGQAVVEVGLPAVRGGRRRGQDVAPPPPPRRRRRDRRRYRGRCRPSRRRPGSAAAPAGSAGPRSSRRDR